VAQIRASNRKVLVLAGDGIGPEIMRQTLRVIEFFDQRRIASFEISEGLVGGAALDPGCFGQRGAPRPVAAPGVALPRHRMLLLPLAHRPRRSGGRRRISRHPPTQRLGPDDIRVSRVQRKDLTPGALAPGLRSFDADALHLSSQSAGQGSPQSPTS